LANGSYASATDALQDLWDLRPAPTVPPHSKPKRNIWPAVVIAVLVVVAAFGATRLGRRSSGPNFVQGGRINAKALRIAAVLDFDPLRDGREGHNTFRNIHDGDSTT